MKNDSSFTSKLNHFSIDTKGEWAPFLWLRPFLSPLEGRREGRSQIEGISSFLRPLFIIILGWSRNVDKFSKIDSSGIYIYIYALYIIYNIIIPSMIIYTYIYIQLHEYIYIYIYIYDYCLLPISYCLLPIINILIP